MDCSLSLAFIAIQQMTCTFMTFFFTYWFNLHMHTNIGSSPWFTPPSQSNHCHCKACFSLNFVKFCFPDNCAFASISDLQEYKGVIYTFKILGSNVA
jgi:hypothetical protein